MKNYFKCDPEIGKKCKNNALCYLCDGERLLKLPKEYKPPQRTVRKRKQGLELEKDVVKKWNKTNIKNKAIRTPNSGALSNFLGDVVTSDDLLECKERGTTTSKGVKSFTISLDWILKAKREMISSGKSNWYIPFRFKGNDEIFIIKDFNHELELLETIEQLLREREEQNG